MLGSADFELEEGKALPSPRMIEAMIRDKSRECDGKTSGHVPIPLKIGRLELAAGRATRFHSTNRRRSIKGDEA